MEVGGGLQRGGRGFPEGAGWSFQRGDRRGILERDGQGISEGVFRGGLVRVYRGRSARDF